MSEIACTKKRNAIKLSPIAEIFKIYLPTCCSAVFRMDMHVSYGFYPPSQSLPRQSPYGRRPGNHSAVGGVDKCEEGNPTNGGLRLGGLFAAANLEVLWTLHMGLHFVLFVTYNCYTFNYVYSH